jgi:hypothetical protein
MVLCQFCKWLEDEFLGYLEEWENDAKVAKKDLSKEERNKTMLSEQTIEGLKITETNNINSIIIYSIFICGSCS